VLEALGWGSVAAASLVIGALLALSRPWSRRQVGIVLAFGAGALISAVSVELVEEGLRIGGLGWTAVGLATGAVTYYVLDGVIEQRFGAGEGEQAGGGAGVPLALGAFLDGVPEMLVLGIGFAADEGVGFGLLAAIFVSNLPEAIGSAGDMRDAGVGRRRIMALWTGVAVICAAATVVGYALADAVRNEPQAVLNGFAAGALLVLLVDSMIPQARHEAGRPAGLVGTLGFAVAAALSSLS
jgi:zinc transporter, ZIP family